MSEKIEFLRKKITVFISDINECSNNTTHPVDRMLYEKDIVFVTRWLIDLDKNQDYKSVLIKIFDTSTSKFLLDYYKRGEWGDKEAKSFTNLKQGLAEYFKI